MRKMPKGTKQDPYVRFKDDVQRRKALNTRVRWEAAGAFFSRLPWLLILGELLK